MASGFPGVEHAYAIQAGREVRVIANAHRATDADALRSATKSPGRSSSNSTIPARSR